MARLPTTQSGTDPMRSALLDSRCEKMARYQASLTEPGSQLAHINASASRALPVDFPLGDWLLYQAVTTAGILAFIGLGYALDSLLPEGLGETVFKTIVFLLMLAIVVAYSNKRRA